MGRSGGGVEHQRLQISSILIHSSAENFPLVALEPETAQCHHQVRPMPPHICISIYVYVYSFYMYIYLCILCIHIY